MIKQILGADRVPAGFTATPNGPGLALIVPTTELEAVPITETVLRSQSRGEVNRWMPHWGARPTL